MNPAPTEDGRLEHYVSTAPFEPEAAETLTPEQRQTIAEMMAMRGKRH